MEGKELNANNNEDDVKLSASEQSTLASRGYTLINKLNEGSYAKVYLSQYRDTKNNKTTTLACKIMDTSCAPKEFVRKFLPREIEMLMKLNHPHLVHTHSIFQRRNKYFIFMRYMEKGDLLEYVLQKGAIPEDQARIWTRQLALAVQYMHELEIAHRDIKCENVLLTANNNAKLCDFGFSRNCVDKKFVSIRSETFCGSLSYTAPEILQGCPYFPKPTDVWSLGIVLFVMTNRAMPFDEKHIKQLLQAQLNKEWKFRARYVDNFSSNLKRLVNRMLDPNHATRIKIENIISSDWIAMDSRLSELTVQEANALKKAREKKSELLHQTQNDQPNTTVECSILEEDKSILKQSSPIATRSKPSRSWGLK